LILRLMALDPAPAVFLGRPCFNGFSDTAQCNYTLWNDARYSEPVVASMTAALGRLAKQVGAERVVLMGASGGGALAVLIADRIDYVDGIVTVAANLDTKAWLAYHEYSGMRQSLNPAVDGRRNEARHRYVFERHYSGGRDQIVPSGTVTKGLRSSNELIVIPNYDHNCCWADIWPQILTDVAQLTDKVPAASSSNR
jgi:dienelactone hydrolase